ncbi:MAG: hypothetical protein K2M29_08980, partial [Paramuribaculum sp.]|nr:hypothetical protein [Paramuribaculum sp.]
HRYMEQTVEPLIDRERQRGEEEIRLKGTDMTTLQRLQKELDQRLENMRIEGEKDFRCLFISRRLASDRRHSATSHYRPHERAPQTQ